MIARGILLRICCLAFGMGAARIAAQTVEEFPLRASQVSTSPAQSVEEVVYRHNNFDDRGFNRAVHKVAVPTMTVYR